jgi:hypothetical protein
MHVIEKKCIWSFGQGTQTEETTCKIYLGFDRIMLKWILKKQGEGVWTGFRIRTSGKLLYRQ